MEVFQAGNIIYKWAMASMAMLNNQWVPYVKTHHSSGETLITALGPETRVPTTAPAAAPVRRSMQKLQKTMQI